jgi:hypothetical protein
MISVNYEKIFGRLGKPVAISSVRQRKENGAQKAARMEMGMKDDNDKGFLQGICDYSSRLSATECLTHLELAMTNSAFGHQYALFALQETDDLGEGADEIRQTLESFKRDYFSARVQFENMDGERLKAFESDLQSQKVAVFDRTPVYLH